MKVIVTKEIIGKIGKDSTVKEFRVNLYEDGEYVDRFLLNLQDRTIISGLNFCHNLLKVKSFEDYVDLIEKLGLDTPICLSYKEHEMPSCKGLCIFWDRGGKTYDITFDINITQEQAQAFFRMYREEIKKLRWVD